MSCILAARLVSGKSSQNCECPVSCEYDEIDVKLSYTEFGSAGTSVDEMNRKYYNVQDIGQGHGKEFYRLAIFKIYNFLGILDFITTNMYHYHFNSC